MQNRYLRRSAFWTSALACGCLAGVIAYVILWSTTGDYTYLRYAAAPALLSGVFYALRMSAKAAIEYEEQEARARRLTNLRRGMPT